MAPKRTADVNLPADQPKPKQARREKPSAKASTPLHQPETDAAYAQVQLILQNEMPRPQFVGLCAYLCTILTWGYSIHVNQLDAFILRYPEYEAVYPQFQVEFEKKKTDGIPSYHYWFHTDSTTNPAMTQGVILWESRLRNIGRENPFSFMCAELNLNFIAEKAKLALVEEEWDEAFAKLAASEHSGERSN